MSGESKRYLHFNFGYLLGAGLGDSREIALDYPEVIFDDELRLQPMTGVFEATRTSEGIYIEGKLHTFFPIICARCLDDALTPIVVELNELFHFQGTAPEGGYEIGDDGALDMTPLAREMSLLALPIKPLCRDDCAGICPECGVNRNEEACHCINEKIDPRLEKLKELLG